MSSWSCVGVCKVEQTVSGRSGEMPKGRPAWGGNWIGPLMDSQRGSVESRASRCGNPRGSGVAVSELVRPIIVMSSWVCRTKG